MSDASFSEVFSHALRGVPCSVVGFGDTPVQLPVAEWTREADAGDHALLDLCSGPTIDVGCGPGRMTEALAERGHVVLGIDVVHEAVGQTRERGVSALRRDVFARLPGEGRWETALLADGNIGIGGDPVSLLRRLRELLDPRGRVVVELAGPGTGLESCWATLSCGDTASRPFRWSVLGTDAVVDVAGDAGLEVEHVLDLDGRWVAVLVEPGSRP